MLAGDLQDRGSALLDGAEGEVFNTHQGKDGAQVVNRSLQAGIRLDVKGEFGLLVSLGNHLVHDLLLQSRGGLVRDLNDLGRLGGLYLLHGGSLRLLDLYKDLGRDGLKQLAGGEFQYLVADMDVIAVNAQRLAGGLYGGLNGLGAHFHTAHKREPPSYFLSLRSSQRGAGRAHIECAPTAAGDTLPHSRQRRGRAMLAPTVSATGARLFCRVINPYSAGWCARPCRVRPRAGGPSPGAACWPRPG